MTEFAHPLAANERISVRRIQWSYSYEPFPVPDNAIDVARKALVMAQNFSSDYEFYYSREPFPQGDVWGTTTDNDSKHRCVVIDGQSLWIVADHNDDGQLCNVMLVFYQAFDCRGLGRDCCNGPCESHAFECMDEACSNEPDEHCSPSWPEVEAALNQ